MKESGRRRGGSEARSAKSAISLARQGRPTRKVPLPSSVGWISNTSLAVRACSEMSAKALGDASDSLMVKGPFSARVMVPTVLSYTVELGVSYEPTCNLL